MPERYKDPAWLYEQYVEGDRSGADIGEQFGVTYQTIHYWVSKFRDDDAWPPENSTDNADVVLDLELGDKVDIDPSTREWTKPLYVVSITDAICWDVPHGEDWTTGSVEIERKEDGPTYELLVRPDEIAIYGEINGEPRRQIATVAAIEHAGTVSPSKRTQLIGRQQAEQTDKPTGDDTWRKYHLRGEADA